MLCASTKVRVTNRTGRIPGKAKTWLSGSRLPSVCPGKSGTFIVTQAIRISVRPLMIPNEARHPITAPKYVPAGMPSDSASGVPIIATAMARPFDPSGTIRAA
jgi:hypothetical protein